MNVLKLLFESFLIVTGDIGPVSVSLDSLVQYFLPLIGGLFFLLLLLPLEFILGGSL